MKHRLTIQAEDTILDFQKNSTGFIRFLKLNFLKKHI